MVELVDNNDVKDALADIGVVLKDEIVLSKMKTLCICFDLSAEELASHWYSYASKNKKVSATSPSIVNLELFEKNVLSKDLVSKLKEADDISLDYQKIVSIKKEIALKKEIKLEQMESDVVLLSVQEPIVPIEDEKVAVKVESNDEPIEVDKEIIKENISGDDQPIEKPMFISGDDDQPVEKPMFISGDDDQPVEKPMVISEETDNSQRVNAISSQLGQPVSDDAWQTSSVIPLDKSCVTLFNPNSLTTKNWQTMQIRLHNLGSILDDIVNDTATVLEEKAGVERWQDFACEGVAEDYFVGRVFKSSARERATDQNLFLEGLSSIRKQIKLELSGTPEFALFPGQVVGLKGVNEGDKGLRVSTFLNQSTAHCLPTAPVLLKHPLHLLIASGPFDKVGDTSAWDKFVEYVGQKKPHLVILAGPFVDSRDPNLFNIDAEEKFAGMMTRLLEASQTASTHFVIVPSPRDFHNPNTFPAPPFSKSIDYPIVNERVHMMSNPCTFSVSGIVFGVSSVDILLHFVKEEVTRFSQEQEAGNRMTRLCNHLLSQRSFYPLFPPSTDVNMEFSVMKEVQLPVSPHFLILPSDLKNFCKNVNGSICVNPERIAKGFFARAIVRNPPSENYAGSVHEFTDIEILKL